jgi:hypothetical protein
MNLAPPSTFEIAFQILARRQDYQKVCRAHTLRSKVAEIWRKVHDEQRSNQPGRGAQAEHEAVRAARLAAHEAELGAARRAQAEGLAAQRADQARPPFLKAQFQELFLKVQF